MSDPTRPYDLRFEERPGYLFASVSAPTIDRSMALDYLHQVADKASASMHTRIMIERNIPVMLPDADLFFTTQDFLKMVGNKRVAFVNRHAKIRPEMDFAMLIGTNRGANYKLFADTASAEEWLMAGTKGTTSN
jgi:hypothetical protein